MKKANIMLKLIFKLFIITPIVFSCKVDTKPIYKSQVDSESIEVTINKKLNFDNEKEWIEIRVNNLTPIIISSEEVSGCFEPYDPKMLETSTVIYLDTVFKELIIDNFKIGKHRFAIYLDPKIYPKNDFIAITKVLSASFKKIEEAIYNDYFKTTSNRFNYLQFSSIIYNNRKYFERTYSKSPRNFITIDADGKVIKVESDSSSSKKVYLGKATLKDSLLNTVDIKEPYNEYKNNQNRYLTQDFRIVSIKNELQFVKKIK